MSKLTVCKCGDVLTEEDERERDAEIKDIKKALPGSNPARCMKCRLIDMGVDPDTPIDANAEWAKGFKI